MAPAKEVVGRLADLAPGTATRVEVGGRAIALVRIGDDVYALGDVCSHQNISLSEGEVDADERTLECWKHGSAFSVETGEALTLPATRPVPVYDARIEGDDIVVVIDE
jgi:3-phenylpropionate/trans-cinnamate dioxygenase ferredoxin subunit